MALLGIFHENPFTKVVYCTTKTHFLPQKFSKQYKSFHGKSLNYQPFHKIVPPLASSCYKGPKNTKMIIKVTYLQGMEVAEILSFQNPYFAGIFGGGRKKDEKMTSFFLFVLF